MKKILTFLMTAVLLISALSICVSAKEPEDILLSRTLETLENGDVVITELYENAVQPRTGKTGYKVGSYTSGEKTIWNVRVDGSFTYTYGVSSQATAAKATVKIYDSNASYVSRSAYTSGNTATATGTVTYLHSTTTRSVSISCDKYGNLY